MYLCHYKTLLFDTNIKLTFKAFKKKKLVLFMI